MQICCHKQVWNRETTSWALESVCAALEGKDSFVILPTGAGKSRCFQIFPFVYESLIQEKKVPMVVVIQPLTLLVESQVKELQKRGIAAQYFGSTQKDPSALKEADHEEGKYTFRKFFNTPNHKANFLIFFFRSLHVPRNSRDQALAGFLREKEDRDWIGGDR